MGTGDITLMRLSVREEGHSLGLMNRLLRSLDLAVDISKYHKIDMQC